MGLRLLSPKNTRCVLDLTERGLPEAPLVGVNNQLAAEGPLEPHTHRGLLEICCLKKGTQIFEVGGRHYRLRGGDVFVTLPDEEHGTGGAAFSRALLYWMQIRLPARGESFLQLNSAASWALAERLRQISRPHFPAGTRATAAFEAIFRLAQRPAGPLDALHLSSAIVFWLLIVLEASERAPAPPLTPDIARCLHRIEEELAENPSIEDLAHHAHLSESRFKAKFKEQLGMPPGEYILRRKIEEAEQRLRHTRDSITRIAFDLGFCSSQHFATTFKKFTGRAPREARAGTA